MILDLDALMAETGSRNREELIYHIRLRYTTASQIAMLAVTELRSADPSLVDYCDREMAWFFDDLGNDFFDSFSGVINALDNGTRLATHPTTGDLRNKYPGMPAIVLGAGPGASERWDAIKASRGHAVLIVCDVMLKACLDRGIVPDYVSAQERLPLVYESMAGLDKTGITLLAPMVVERRTVEDFGGRVVWCWRGCNMETWVDYRIPRNNFGRSCGVQGIGAALLAGCSPVYLVGHDLCMQGSATHAAGVHAMTEQTKAYIEADRDDYHRKQPAKSISGRDVVTTHLWGMFKSDIQHIVKEHPGSTVINTGDGLPIEATKHGELPWDPRNRVQPFMDDLELPVLTRAEPGNDPATMIPVMLKDLPSIEKRCLAALELATPDPLVLQISTMVDPLTAGAWTEIYGSTFASALIRLNLQPSQHLDMIKRVAKTMLATLPHVERSLKEISR